MAAQWRDDFPSNVHVTKASAEVRRWDEIRAEADRVYADCEPPVGWTADPWADWALAGLFLGSVLVAFLAGVGLFGLCAGWL